MVSLSLLLCLGSFTVRKGVLILVYLQLCRDKMYLRISLPLVFQATLSKQRSKHLPSHFTTNEKPSQDLLFLTLPRLCWITGFSPSSSLFCILLARLQTHGSSPEPGKLFLCHVPFSLQSFNYHFRTIITQGYRTSRRERWSEQEREFPIRFPLEAQKRNAVVL